MVAQEVVHHVTCDDSYPRLIRLGNCIPEQENFNLALPNGVQRNQWL